MKTMVKITYMFVQHALLKVNLTHILRKIFVVQKTNIKSRDFNTRVFPTRTVYSSIKHNGQSTNWKHNWLLHNKCSFVEVLLRNGKKNSKVLVDNYSQQNGYSDNAMYTVGTENLSFESSECFQTKIPTLHHADSSLHDITVNKQSVEHIHKIVTATSTHNFLKAQVEC